LSSRCGELPYDFRSHCTLQHLANITTELRVLLVPQCFICEDMFCTISQLMQPAGSDGTADLIFFVAQEAGYWLVAVATGYAKCHSVGCYVLCS
jgi:hypothetical protein